MAVWTKDQVTELKALYPTATREELEKRIGKKFVNISAKASSLGVKREKGTVKNIAKLEKKKSGKWGDDAIKLQDMIDDRASAGELVEQFKRPIGEILEEAKKLDMDCGYLEGASHSASMALPFEKEIKSRLGLVLDLDVTVNIRNFRVVMNG